jgi:hypothetical protein
MQRLEGQIHFRSIARSSSDFISALIRVPERFPVGSSTSSQEGEIPYRIAQRAFDPFFPNTGEVISYWKSLFLDDLDDAAIERPSARTMIGSFRSRRSTIQRTSSGSTTASKGIDHVQLYWLLTNIITLFWGRSDPKAAMLLELALRIGKLYPEQPCPCSTDDPAV